MIAYVLWFLIIKNVINVDLSEYKLKIPNVLNVQEPCNSSSKVVNIGSLDSESDGILNQFGHDFQRIKVKLF